MLEAVVFPGRNSLQCGSRAFLALIVLLVPLSFIAAEPPTVALSDFIVNSDIASQVEIGMLLSVRSMVAGSITDMDGIPKGW